MLNFIFFKINYYKNFVYANLFFFKKHFNRELYFVNQIIFKNVFQKEFWIHKKSNQSHNRLKKKLQISRNYSRKPIFFFKFSIKNFEYKFFYNTNIKFLSFFIILFFDFKTTLKKNVINFYNYYKNTFGEGYVFIRGLIIVFFLDACVTDDEPLWEPIEWSLVQTWILFIFIFAWIAENLITSRFGSFTGRDKRVWFAWYKTFWLIDLSYIISYALAAVFVIVPFYYELTYSLSFINSWWTWYTRVFFFKFIFIFSLILLLSNILLINLKWLNWKKLILLIFLVNFFLSYLLYTHFIMAFFGYFTDPLWYQNSRTVDLIQLSHEPLKWGWGSANRDHYSYHKVSTVFWFKNDGPFAGAFLMVHMFLFLTIFFLNLYWLVLLRKVYSSKEITFTFTTVCVSALKQFFFFFLLMYLLIFMSYIVSYWRFPIEFLWLSNSQSWLHHFFNICFDYFFFIINIFKII